MEDLNCERATATNTLAQVLRLELKEWEQSFAATHQGRKAGREDIKQRPEIAHKYKQYNRLRRPSSKNLPPHNATLSEKRSATNSYPVCSSHSPYKRPKHAHPIHPSAIRSHDPPSPTHLSPRTHRTSIGPTPQKDGQVLGLFDQISAVSISQTPSKRKALRSVEGSMLTTPSKHPQPTDRKDTDIIYQKSPLSGTKSKLLNDLLTPCARRTTCCSTPVSRNGVSNFCFDDTPAFLRRDSRQAEVGKEKVFGHEEGLSWSPVAVRKMPKAAGRGLSALVRGLREMEDEELDEELDLLKEMESEGAPRNDLNQPQVLVNDSQRPDMPLGPDGGLVNDEDRVEYVDEEKGRDGRPLKVWKKKGQKRTTRKVLMKPNTAKWKPEAAWKVGQANLDEEDVVAETQTVSADGSIYRKEQGCDSDEYEDIEGSQGAMEAANGRMNAFGKDLEEKELLSKKIKKKISATAHSNFRALKIKNKQSKGKKGSRFGRKR
ncbi:MAG: regulatory particle non-ATPase [Alectoria fallacina]|uniref:DNA replication regulator SLD2 n=1 Tax=Alectoria fallacina TaxID=1903189 RepID=A0A8H3FDS6_9LECA|nr:MAG: regulatory particle non-ATPase [Alectoria fallacina]